LTLSKFVGAVLEVGGEGKTVGPQTNRNLEWMSASDFRGGIAPRNQERTMSNRGELEHEGGSPSI